MAQPDDHIPITELLQRYSDGDSEAGEALASIVYESLHAQAERMIKGEHNSHTLQATGLVHEAWIRLRIDDSSAFDSRLHFHRLAGRVMRNVLVDHARRKHAEKRRQKPNDAQHEIEELHISLSDNKHDPIEVITLNDALEKLQDLDPELAQIIEHRFFGGLTFEETAQAIGTSTACAFRSWKLAQAWLLKELGR